MSRSSVETEKVHYLNISRAALAENIVIGPCLTIKATICIIHYDKGHVSSCRWDLFPKFWIVHWSPVNAHWGFLRVEAASRNDSTSNLSNVFLQISLMSVFRLVTIASYRATQLAWASIHGSKGNLHWNLTQTSSCYHLTVEDHQPVVRKQGGPSPGKERIMRR